MIRPNSVFTLSYSSAGTGVCKGLQPGGGGGTFGWPPRPGGGGGSDDGGGNARGWRLPPGGGDPPPPGWPGGDPPPPAGPSHFRIDDDSDVPVLEHRAKEADKITVGNWPATVAAYRLWRLALVDEVVAASARPDDAFTWITAVAEGAKVDDLNNTNFPYTRPMNLALKHICRCRAIHRCLSLYPPHHKTKNT